MPSSAEPFARTGAPGVAGVVAQARSSEDAGRDVGPQGVEGIVLVLVVVVVVAVVSVVLSKEVEMVCCWARDAAAAVALSSCARARAV